MTSVRGAGEAETHPIGPSDRVVRASRTVSPWFVDVVVALATLGVSIGNIATQDAIGLAGIPPGGYVLLSAGSVAIALRRRWPIAVLAAALLMTVLWSALGYPGNPVLHVLVALYTVGRHVSDWRTGVPALAIALAVMGFEQTLDEDPLAEVAGALVLTFLPWYVGRRVRIRADYAAAAKARAEFLAWKREADAQRTIDDARATMARELHDVVAHTVSVMTVQAGLARVVLRDDPDRAEEAIIAVENAGRSATDELRHLLAVLRSETPSNGLSPQPGLVQVPALVDQLRAAGVESTLVMAVESEIPSRVDLFAYRIVQEALTNVLKHAGPGATAQLRIEQVGDALEVEVLDTGGGAIQLDGSGRGLVGMRERALLLGGSFDAGPRLGGGFRVVAHLPIGAS